MTNGSCLCGQITFTVDGPMRAVVFCHCQQCRKTSGHYVAATSAPRDKITISGNVSWYHASDDARRGFCATCGSSVFWDRHKANYLSIHAGVLDGDTELYAKGHIFCADKGDYYELSDELPKAQASDPNLTTSPK